MSIIAILIIIIAVGVIAGGVLLLKQSAKKFNLTDEQLTKIKARNKEIEQEEKEQD
ncbi:DUF2897 family protein [Litorilituus lipolyticus]|uniref:DUF2897 family protein n=1 Tax=Litorilituus lipolyticus TaxID=2491017 RepID=A0A502KRS3_9GAMM|nr:DUF2897 family protein [Litorilituus lipolyticus]TPH13884.1 DUF2897 family protein [Litorilituus lipolyticus]